MDQNHTLDHTDFNTVINAPHSKYRYKPSLPAAIIFIILFSLTTGGHVFQLIRRRIWYFIPLAIGGVCKWSNEAVHQVFSKANALQVESVGYVGRAIGSKETPDWTLGPFIIQIVLLLVAPALFAATIYMSLGHIILSVDGESVSLIRKKWLTKVFVCGDVLSFLVQAAGGGVLAGGTAKAATNGQRLILLGLFLQVIFFGLFVLVAVVFHIRLRKAPTNKSLDPNAPWRRRLIVLYVASALIMVRSVVRIIEYIQGNRGNILTHEVFLYLFDSVLMLAVMVLFNVEHPSQVKPRSRKDMADDSMQLD
ncbi:MAG: hypothetical protein M1824_003339 [Vezdaea acicularis]|nr:MAG: hypothetical protein M1824_003339 [Vezdaea acicularis]